MFHFVAIACFLVSLGMILSKDEWTLGDRVWVWVDVVGIAANLLFIFLLMGR